jgi:D-glycero-D-manno-heptose 1,7-bisphosphate phosphatase
MLPIIILDRDGVINYDSDAYIKSPNEWLPIPGSLESIAALKQAGYKVAVATNQSGIARGYYTVDTLTAIHTKMQQALAEFNAEIDAIFYCPHGPDDDCNCRKPKPGLLLQAAEFFQVPAHNFLMIGDSLRDSQAAHAVNAKAILVATGKPLARDKLPTDVPVYSDLATAVNKIILNS